MTAITAAVVGVILNLGVHFARHALWPGEAEGGVDWFIAVLSVVAFLALHRFRVGLLPVLGGCALAGFLAF